MKDIEDVSGSFGVLETSGDAQTAVMRLKRGEASGELGNEHPGSLQVLFIIDGAVEAEIDGQRVLLQPGQSVIVPRGAPHRFSGASDRTAVTFNVYSPPFY
jgi:mannose-6-phosphate isomerase-like protein (cupin superfamily)